MIADCVDFEEYKNGTRPDGVFFSGQTFLAKLTTGIATILSAAAYAYVGFSDEKVDALSRYIENMGPDDLLPRLNPEYDSIMMILFFLISIPPAIGCILSVIPTLKYALNDDVHDVILRELNERRQLSEKELLPDMAVSDDSSAKEND
jgi:Na+/melibiose symporter-like transporter